MRNKMIVMVLPLIILIKEKEMDYEMPPVWKRN